mmetsp:Transcript_63345/g.74156  ORF Transcript_63345/g.74156 Transcript_63345/m.74156 type:complete len:246 (+) Transcript_63345:90-827(+)|eukprot:CAMPEP_0194371854 /NCGR_PEP_ID=MMETSP0174-20130528/20226_1 /TAXON_ID=216777 /ORGANISM="Proboscia alata, Strain PI-D3" /LENGTH=245 /DNA_ID=CAMNT_0039150093 /DNA_START=57 /DNA_END=794 /DNA_ORIENTATION=-
MVYGLISSIRASVKYRGGWKGFFDHMYTNGDYPFKFGTLMGSDPAGNKYYENRVDYPFGQHRWVEPGDTHNFDSASVPPEWNGWMNSMNDIAPETEDIYFENSKEQIVPVCHSDSPDDLHVGHQEKVFNFHHLHNQTSVRSRGYGIGNPLIGLPPHTKAGYYTQPGSQYNEASMKKKVVIGQHDDNRKFTSKKWEERLRTSEEKDAILQAAQDAAKKLVDQVTDNAASRRANKRRNRGGLSSAGF